ncbi:alpha/beta hydrolase [Ferrovibrio sp.]|uniref:alpha/beta hydrolase n=1 Tax=Ferrovibrio sp. TaxID=1917215 RepID=UPI00263642B0|nr:alpha/beta hydrolase [Ferrovibrio sp.]
MPDIIFPGPDGRLEGRYTHGPEANAPIALILHPHPLYGGTMNNKVVYNLFHVFAKRGFSVLRFNFRGVGRSQGTFDHGTGELSDAASALDWLQAYNPNASAVWIAGFSFGAWISMQLLMRRPEIDGFISVAPPAGMYDFGFLAPCPSSGLIIQGTDDKIVSEAEVAKLAQRLSLQKGIKIDYKKVQGADHFFEGKLDELTAACDKYVKTSLVPTSARAGKGAVAANTNPQSNS